MRLFRTLSQSVGFLCKSNKLCSFISSFKMKIFFVKQTKETTNIVLYFYSLFEVLTEVLFVQIECYIYVFILFF